MGQVAEVKDPHPVDQD